MANVKVNGIVIYCANYKDNDKMLTIFTPDKGSVSVFSRGCKRPKSPLLQASEPFVAGEFLLYEKNGKYSLTSCSIDKYYYNLRLDHFKLSCGSYMLQLCNAVVQANEENKPLFNCLLKSLDMLSETDVDPLIIMNKFLMDFSIISGYKPRIKHCVNCGIRIVPENYKFIEFDAFEGGFYCSNCNNLINTKKEKITIQTYSELLSIVETNGYIKNPNKKAQKEVFDLLCGYLEIQFQQTFKASKFLKGLINP